MKILNKVANIKLSKQIVSMVLILCALLSASSTLILMNLDKVASNSDQRIGMAADHIKNVYEYEVMSTWRTRLSFSKMLSNRITQEEFGDQLLNWHKGIVEGFIDDGTAGADKRKDLFEAYYQTVGKFEHYIDGYSKYKTISKHEYDKWLNQVDGSAKALIGELEAFTQELSERVDVSLQFSGEEREVAVAQALGITLTLSMIAAILFSLYLSKLSKPITRVTETLESFSNGNLVNAPTLSGSSEIISISQSLKSFRTTLATLVSNLRTIGSSLSVEGQELQKVVNTLSENSNKELEQIELISVATTELASTSKEVSEQAIQAEACASQVVNAIEIGQRELENAKESRQLTKEAVLTSNDIVVELHESSNEISKVVDVIHNISEQTNLLALNAAIEAARAGEQGRGFSVVADEVRMLAAQTQKSTESIKEVISRLQEKSFVATEEIKKTVEQLEISSQANEEADRSFENIISEIENINHINAMVASASLQQANVTGEISQNIVLCSDSIKATATSVSGLVEKATSLQSLSDQQISELSNFSHDE
ncbi:methyl-accepting chemotaxis protein [Vibrio sonorensis]|uniref:methyl-accepting chemotaxis protein n=1 Tax=Vibrio sonorensis TaxID=1004316 RepID=UPI001586F461|nr:methyl-accepting chemotaxis protein [Vibrio sonorensis]